MAFSADQFCVCISLRMLSMAEQVARSGGIEVVYDIQDTAKNGFPDTLYMDLDTRKLQKIGWCPLDGGRQLINMYERMLKYMKR